MRSDCPLRSVRCRIAEDRGPHGSARGIQIRLHLHDSSCSQPAAREEICRCPGDPETEQKKDQADPEQHAPLARSCRSFFLDSHLAAMIA